MKKILILIFAMALTLSFAACSGTSSTDNTGNSPASTAGNSTADNINSGNSSTVLDGDFTAEVSDWNKLSNPSGNGVSFSHSTTGSIVTLSSAYNTASLDSYVDKTITELKKSYPTVQLDPTATITIGGLDARQYSYIDGSDYKTIFVFAKKDNTMFTITYAGKASDYDAEKDDCQTIIDSFTVK